MKKAKFFIPGITLEEQQQKAQEIYETEVMPQLAREQERAQQKDADVEPVLSPVQKAHLKCQNPI